MDVTEWREIFTRSALNFAALSILSEGSSHGYSMQQKMKERGLGHIKGGTLYPLLQRLEGRGLLSSSWETPQAGPARRVFDITEAGQQSLRDAERAWSEIGNSLHWGRKES